MKIQISLALCLAFLLPTLALPATYEGYGSATTGGNAFQATPTIVSNCSNGTGAGSMRAALASGNRYVDVQVGCPTVVEFGSTFVYVNSNTTVWGHNAPAPGYRYRGTFAVDGRHSNSLCGGTCANVIISGLIYEGNVQVPASCNIGVTIERGAFNVVVDRNTFYQCGNDCLGITANDGGTFRDTRDITISRNAFIDPKRPGDGVTPGTQCPGDSVDEGGAETATVMDMRPRRVTYHHNFIHNSKRRSPLTRYGTVAPIDTTMEWINNLVHLVSGPASRDAGSFLSRNVRVNVINNYYKAKAGLTSDEQKREIVVCKTSGTAPEDVAGCGNAAEGPVSGAYLSGNISDEGHNLDAKRTTATPFTGSGSVTTSDACTATQSVRQDSGGPHKSAAVLAAYNSVTLTQCAIVEPPQTTYRFPFTPY